MLLLLQAYAAPRLPVLVMGAMQRKPNEDWLWLIAAALLEIDE